MPFLLSGHMNGICVVTPQTPHRKCQGCGLILEVEPVGLDTEHRATTGDLSMTSDGFWIATAKFKRMVEEADLEGVAFLPLSRKQFVFLPKRAVRLHGGGFEQEPHGPICDACGHPKQHTAKSFTLALGRDEVLGRSEIVSAQSNFVMRTIGKKNLAFFDSPILVGDGVAEALKGKRLRGLAFVKMVSADILDAKERDMGGKDMAG
ncbi:hypothetical protein [Cypionkella psychrotolerans]|uniref:hypothetical protein n=1 Tax=Cypionkella psychrotolerans TaxID=1678131 RepID=UPI0006B62ED5|nr:hypothetical protein [Cypionkella psychrotolerans]